MPHHLIFEGPELAGKSWVMSQVYEHLEKKYNQSGVVLDGCHWFNCDVGIFGTEYGQPVIEKYLDIAAILTDKNILMEKLHISDIVYNRMHFKREINYAAAEKKLKGLDFKIIFITFPENEQIIEQRIRDRLNLYPHYERILKSPKWYISQQAEYRKEMEKSQLPYLNINTERFPDPACAQKILKWIKET